MPRCSELVGDLAAVVGDGYVGPADVDDAVAGVPAGVVVKPGDGAEVAGVLAVADRHRATVVARGHATKLDWGASPASVDLVVDLGRLGRVIEHAPGDLVVRVQCGLGLSDLAAALRPAGQRLAVDEVVASSTIGGIIATGLSGPLRLAHGSVRDVLLGVTVARADGLAVKAGSKVVKNVAGYDLAKLYTGSFGTLGIVTEAIFRLHPVPERRLWIGASPADEGALGAAASAALGSPSVLSALELRRGPDGAVELAALIEGSDRAAPARAEAVAALLGPGAEIADTPPPWWASLPAAATLLKLAVPIAEVPALLAGLGDAVEVIGSAGVGVVYAGLSSLVAPDAVAGVVADTRRACAAAGGSAVVLRAPLDVRALVDMWGPVPAVGLMRRVKDGFDPGHLLAPGRFVGGI